MAVLTVRNVPDHVHRALRARAAEQGRSMEAEVREILAAAVLPAARIRMGDALVALGRELELDDDGIDVVEQIRDRTPAVPTTLS